MESKNQLWNKFYKSGKVEDYINYRNAVDGVKKTDAVEHKGTDNSGDDHRRTEQNNNSFNG